MYDIINIYYYDWNDTAMINAKVHRLILNKTRFDMISADTDFYKFVDDSRLYHTFERLICEGDRQKFIDNVDKGVQEWFIVHMVGLDDSVVPCYLSVGNSVGEDNIEVVLLDINMLLESEKELDIRNKCLDNVLSLYGDDIFV